MPLNMVAISTLCTRGQQISVKLQKTPKSSYLAGFQTPDGALAKLAIFQ